MHHHQHCPEGGFERSSQAVFNTHADSEGVMQDIGHQ